MIVSHKYKFIFLKTEKTAGTSIEISLSRFCGENDIITPLPEEDEKIRRELKVFPQNYIEENYQLKEYSIKDFLRLIIRRKRPQKQRFYGQMPAIKVKEAIESEIWDSYFKFCFVRNPWDRAISLYYWHKYYWQNHKDNYLKLNKTEMIEDMGEFLKRRQNLLTLYQMSLYTIEKKIAVDYIGKYETLLEDLRIICDKLNIPFDNWLPNAKGKIRRDKRPYYEILSEAQANLIREICADEIKLFGYEYQNNNKII